MRWILDFLSNMEARRWRAVLATIVVLGAMTALFAVGKSQLGLDAEARLEPHRRRLAEVERLAADGLLAEVELKAARAEAGRSLLAAADQAQVWTPDGAGARKAVVLAVGAACAAAAARRRTISAVLSSRV